MTRIKDLFGAAEAAPFQNESYIEFFRNLLELVSFTFVAVVSEKTPLADARIKMNNLAVALIHMVLSPHGNRECLALEHHRRRANDTAQRKITAQDS